LKKLGKYELLGELGHGAMGVVYRARDPIINRLVALKTITTGVADDPALLQRFYREAQSAGGLQHPNIVTIYDMGEAGDLPYIAMELIEGENLEQLIARRPNLPISLKLVYAMQACRAFDYAHKRGIVHRDIKPGNVMLGKDSTLKVVDFGIARVLEASRTQTGMLIGTFAYMSPEQYHGEHADERSDIWSFGVLLYELLCYERPFAGPTPASLMHKICQETPAPLKKHLPDCPDELEIILTRVLQKVPGDRYQSMEDLLLELDPICKKLQVQLVADLVAQSRELLDKSEFAQARDLLRQALQVESGSQQARMLLEKANAGLKRLANRPSALQFIDKGRLLLQEGKLEAAKDAAESALQLDSTFVPAQELRQAVEQEIEHARLRSETLEAAKQRLAEGLPEEAEVLLAKVLQIEPNNEQALAIQQQVLAEKAERQKRLRLLNGLREARELWTQQNFAECIQRLTDLEKTYPGEEEISRLLESAREDQIEQSRQQGLQEARNLLASGRHEECFAALAGLQKAFPQDEEIPRLLEDARKDQRDRLRLETMMEARSLLAAGQYEGGIALLTSAEKEFPEDQEFRNLLEIARQNQEEQRRQQGIAEARKHFAARRYDVCLSALTELEQSFPGDEEIAKLQAAVREEQAEQRKQEQLKEVRKLLQAKDYQAALELLTSLQAEFPGDDEVGKLSQSARDEQIEQHKRDGLAEARKFLAAKQYDNSISVLQKLQADFPGEAEIRRLLQSTVEELAEQRKQQGLTEARTLLRAKRYAESIAVLETLHSAFPAETEIQRQLATAREDLAEQEKQKKLAEARKRLAAQSFSEAITVLDGLAETYPKDTGVAKLRALAQREQEKYAKNQRIQQELDDLKKLMADKQYPEVISRTKSLLQEFPGEVNFVRVAEFATNQQATIEKESLLRKTLEDAKAHFDANRFEEAIRMAESGLQKFPGNTELLALLEKAEIQQHKLEIRQQIEMRIREIRVKINREKFSEAVDLAKETLVTLGPDTDLTQLLNSAEIEIQARDKKRAQERTISSIRTLMDSGNLEGATLAVEAAVKSNVLETFDPRLQRLNEEIETAKLQAQQKSTVIPAHTHPNTLSREYAFLEAPPLPVDSIQSETSSSVEAPTQQVPARSHAIPSEFGSPATAAEPEVLAPPEEKIPEPTMSAEPSPAVETLASEFSVLTPVPEAQVAVPKIVAEDLPLKEASEQRVAPPLAASTLPIWRKLAVVGASAVVLFAGIWLGVHSLNKNVAPQTATAPAAPSSTKTSAPTVDPREVQQRNALNSANQMIASNDLNRALQTLQQAAAIDGPLASEIQKKQSEIAASLKDANLRQLRQTEEKLWQHAMSRSASGHFVDAQKDLHQVLALPPGGVHRDEAQNYLDKVIPQRIQQNGFLTQSQQALEVGDFQSARRAAGQLKLSGGDPTEVLKDVDQQERAKLNQLVTQFNQLRQRDDDAAIQQLRALQPKFQALTGDGGPQSDEAMKYATSIPGAVAEIQAGAQRKAADTAFQRMVQHYQQAATANDKAGLASARNDFQGIIQGGGPHASEAQRYRSEAESKLAALAEPPPAPVVTPPAAPSKAEVAPHVIDNDAQVRTVIQRYGQAFEHRDADALRQVWPGIGSKYARYKQIFALASAIREQLTIESVEINADATKAVVKSSVFQSYTPKADKNKPQQFTREFVFNLEKTSRGEWVITDVQ
jgi:eukaryotic-like serine/threonine-protein kinase